LIFDGVLRNFLLAGSASGDPPDGPTTAAFGNGTAVALTEMLESQANGFNIPQKSFAQNNLRFERRTGEID
jgi:hypothetical protein